MQMTGKERISNILKRKPVDRIGLFEHFWGDTQKVWAEQGHIKEKEDLATHFGSKIAFCGGMYARNLVANDRDAIKRELEAKIPVVMKDSGYILHSDHSIPTNCEYETYRYFVDEGMRLGTYKK